MIKATTTWNGTQAYAEVRVAGWEAIKRVVAYYHTHLLDAMNTSAGPSRVKVNGKSRTVYTTPSKPGEPPHKRTGFLQKSTVFDLDQKNQSARVGILKNAKYGAFLELGTKRMKARPFLLATLNAILPALRRIAQID